MQIHMAQLHTKSLPVRIWVQSCSTEKGLFSCSWTLSWWILQIFNIFSSGNTGCLWAGWSSYTAQIIYQRAETQPRYTRNVTPEILAAQKCHTVCSALISQYEFSMASPPSISWKVPMLCTYRANWRGEDVGPAWVRGQQLCLMLPGHGLDLGKLHYP